MPLPRIAVWRSDAEGISGHDVVHLRSDEGVFRAEGCAIAIGPSGRPRAVRYAVVADEHWCTRSAVVEILGATGVRRVRLDADGAGQWWIEGRRCPELEGALDVDLGATPFTNTLAIRRLRLAAGEERAARAAWVSPDGDEIEPLDQVYRRVAEDRYVYRVPDAGFAAEIDVDEDGLVVRYPGIGVRVAVHAARGARPA